MKKLLPLSAFALLVACAGYNPVESYWVTLYNNEPYLVSSENVEERTQPLNQVLTAYVGYTVVDRKVYNKEVYAAEELRATKDVIMTGNAGAVSYKINQRVKVIGEINLNGEPYMLIPADLDGYVALVNQYGELYKNIGSLRGNGLNIVYNDFLIRPASFKFESITSSKSKQTRPAKGFDIKYEGIQGDSMVFTYMDYAKFDGDRGYFENISFPLTQENIEIGNVGFKVLKASKDKLDYIILK